MIRIVVVDDEPVARRGLVRLLDAEEGVEVVGQAADGEEALSVLRRERPDAVFLDVEMPGIDGLLVAEGLRGLEHPPLVVFVTAFDQYAVQAFEMEAADYILKPFDAERLQQVLGRVRRQLRRSALDDLDASTRVLRELGGPGTTGSGPGERLVIRDGGTVVFLRPEEVDWIEAAGNYVRVRAGHDEHLVRATLSDMEERLGPHGFLRASRSALVNLARVRRVSPGSSGTYVAVLEDGRRIPISRRAAPRLRRAIEAME
ncbi:MAG: LytR/AlgR family response regulator transcription factor [Gemmatimonadota bacterium]